MFLIDDLLLSPITGFQFIMRTLGRIAEEQYTDDAPVKERLLELQVALDQGDISEEEYLGQEREVLQQLRDIQNRKREMAGLPPEQPGDLANALSSGATLQIELQGEQHDKK